MTLELLDEIHPGEILLEEFMKPLGVTARQLAADMDVPPSRISDIVNQTRFASAAELDDTLANYLSAYNHLIPQRALKHQSPIQALQKWRRKKPELFVKRVNKQSGLDK